MTNQELIDKAFLELEIVEAGNSANATDSADALLIMNELFTTWAVESKNLHIPPQDDLTDTIPLPVWAERGVISNLALDLAVAFNTSTTPGLERKAETGRNTIAKVLMNTRMSGLDMTNLPLGNGRWRHNILNDTTF